MILEMIKTKKKYYILNLNHTQNIKKLMIIK